MQSLEQTLPINKKTIINHVLRILEDILSELSTKTKKRKACAPASVTRPASNSAADPAMPSTSTYRPALLPTPTLPNQKTTSYFNLLKTEHD